MHMHMVAMPTAAMFLALSARPLAVAVAVAVAMPSWLIIVRSPVLMCVAEMAFVVVPAPTAAVQVLQAARRQWQQQLEPEGILAVHVVPAQRMPRLQARGATARRAAAAYAAYLDRRLSLTKPRLEYSARAPLLVISASSTTSSASAAAMRSMALCTSAVPAPQAPMAHRRAPRQALEGVQDLRPCCP